MAAEAQQIIEKLNHIQSDIDYIKEHLEDITLTEEDLISIREAKEDFKAGRTKRLA